VVLDERLSGTSVERKVRVSYSIEYAAVGDGSSDIFRMCNLVPSNRSIPCKSWHPANSGDDVLRC